jgi:hypothetical protein
MALDFKAQDDHPFWSLSIPTVRSIMSPPADEQRWLDPIFIRERMSKAWIGLAVSRTGVN